MDKSAPIRFPLSILAIERLQLRKGAGYSDIIENVAAGMRTWSRNSSIRSCVHMATNVAGLRVISNYDLYLLKRQQSASSFSFPSDCALNYYELFSSSIRTWVIHGL